MGVWGHGDPLAEQLENNQQRTCPQAESHDFCPSNLVFEIVQSQIALEMQDW